jgi:hypothetical protein
MDTKNRDQRHPQEMDRSDKELGSQSGNQARESTNHPRGKFPEPRGWALEWDGFSLSDVQAWYNRPDQPPVGDEPSSR